MEMLCVNLWSGDEHSNKHTRGGYSAKGEEREAKALASLSAERVHMCKETPVQGLISTRNNPQQVHGLEP